MKRNGFTLLEIMIVFAIIALITVVAFTNLFGWKSQTDLQNVTKQVGALLREAQSNSMTQENGTAWGVHFENSTSSAPFYALFASSTYSTSSVVGSYPLPGSVAYLTSTLPVGSSTDIVFNQVSGNASASTSIGFYLLSDPSQSSTINVSAAGAISYLNPAHTTYAGGYLHYRTITIDHTKVSNTDQTNFPMLFSGTYSYLATVANGGGVSNDNGDDIIFTSDSAGQNLLDFEQESYNPTTGAVNYWIRIPTLSHTSDTVIYMFYGNPNVVTSQANPTGVWSNNYAAVWHLNEGTGAIAYDSTANGINGSWAGTQSGTSGYYTSGNNQSFAGYFDATDNAVVLPSGSGDFSGLKSFTVSFWVKTTGMGSNGTFWQRPSLFGKASNGASSGDFGITTNSGHIGFWTGLNSSGDNSFLSATDMVSDGQWHFISASNNGSSATLYVDGAAQGSLSTGLALDNTEPFAIGARYDQPGLCSWGGGCYHDGTFEDATFSNVGRSADWIKTEYNNQSSPSTFYSLGNTDAPIPPPQTGSDFAYFRTITIDHTKVSNTDQTNFPILFSGTYSYLATLANGGNVENVNGDDVIFTSDAAGQNKLNFEQACYNPVTGAVNYWIQIPTLSHTTDTVIYMFYGDSNITKSQANPTAVWDSDYKAVYHFGCTTVNPNDSTSNGNNGAMTNITGTAAPWGIGLAANFNGSAYIAENSPNFPTSTAARTLEMWVKIGGTGSYALGGWGDNNGNGNRWDGWSSSGNNMSIEVRNAGSGFNWTYDTNWHFFVSTLPPGGTTVNNILLYWDGKQMVGSGGTTALTTTDAQFTLGTIPGSAGNNNFNGSEAEVRISDIARSADWIKTEYNNEASPSTFYSVGATDAPPVPPQTGSDFAYTRAVTINHAMVSSTDQTDFPALFSGTYSYLATTANGGDIQTSNGTDVIFTSDSAGNNLLNFEQESYNPVTGAVNYWIQVPTLSHTTDTVIYMFYGDANVTKSQANPTGVWDSNYAGVWHFPDGTTLSANDSTANGGDGTISGATATTGEIDGGAGFNGSAGIALNTGSSLKPTNITLSAWTYSTATGLQVMMGKRESSGTTAPSSYGLSQRNSNTMWFTIGDGGNNEADAASTGLLQNVWQYWVGTYDGATLKLYLNGVLQSTASYSGGIIYSNDYPAYIGYYPYGSYNWQGSIDEARISNVARSAAWIATSYANQSSPSSFYAVGTQNVP